MSLTSAQIVALATQDAKCPGFTSQAGQFLNATLQDLCQNYDLDAALGTFVFSFNSATGQGSGPYNLPGDYLRTQVKDGKDEFFYTIQGVPYPLIQITKAEYDWLVQTPGFQSYPYNYATDLSVSPAQLFVWPPASGAYPCVLRYYRLMPDIATPETSAVVPWFNNTMILQRSVAGRLMGLTGDDRMEKYLGDDEDRFPLGAGTLLKRYLKNVEDREGAVHTVGKDRRRWGRPFDQLKNTKNIGWAIAAMFLWFFAWQTPAEANCTAPCTKAQVQTDINTNWPDNTSGLITPALLRSTVGDLLNSYLDANGASSFVCPANQFFTAIATLSTYTCTQPTFSNIASIGAGVATALTNGINTAGGVVVPTAALTLNGVVYGGGSAVSPGSTAAGTNGQLFLGVTSGAPNWGTLSQDCTITNAGVITCTKTNNVAFTALATTVPGTGVAAALAIAVNTAGGPVTGGNAVTSITPGGGIVSSNTAACSLTSIMTTGTIYTARCINAQVGTSYAIADTDRGKIITASNAAAQGYTLAQAGAASQFQSGWYTIIQNNSSNVAGIVTITATTSTFSNTGSTTMTIQPGQYAKIESDGANYQVVFIANARQLPGTATNDAANTGMLGEQIISTIPVGSAVSLTTNTPANITSISLTAGDWELSGSMGMTGGATTTVQAYRFSFSTNSATDNQVIGFENQQTVPSTTLFSSFSFEAPMPSARVSLLSTTTYFLVAHVNFLVSTLTGYGIIRARRVR
jgi:hypothetical protein